MKLWKMLLAYLVVTATSLALIGVIVVYVIWPPLARFLTANGVKGLE